VGPRLSSDEWLTEWRSLSLEVSSLEVALGSKSRMMGYWSTAPLAPAGWSSFLDSREQDHARERELTLRLPRLVMEASAVPSFCKGFNVVVNGGLGRT
jgi:hypothetical protein